MAVQQAVFVMVTADHVSFLTGQLHGGYEFEAHLNFKVDSAMGLLQ